MPRVVQKPLQHQIESILFLFDVARETTLGDRESSILKLFGDELKLTEIVRSRSMPKKMVASFASEKEHVTTIPSQEHRTPPIGAQLRFRYSLCLRTRGVRGSETSCCTDRVRPHKTNETISCRRPRPRRAIGRPYRAIGNLLVSLGERVSTVNVHRSMVRFTIGFIWYDAVCKDENRLWCCTPRPVRRGGA
ncbi:hypothetical protein EVAR_36128_1 [Eumeta japonica]|uniref:Uncharacterized protein n=1 Tax=Eumeta variegata TaxID=151549 RepID=A0A4C1X162_EUMVA|nr:hypothetical protein EVAR_36128_1 [Eumeta japonica]